MLPTRNVELVDKSAGVYSGNQGDFTTEDATVSLTQARRCERRQRVELLVSLSSGRRARQGGDEEKAQHAGGCRKSVSPVLLATLSGDTLNNKSVSPVLLATVSGGYAQRSAEICEFLSGTVFRNVPTLSGDTLNLRRHLHIEHFFAT